MTLPIANSSSCRAGEFLFAIERPLDGSRGLPEQSISFSSFLVSRSTDLASRPAANRKLAPGRPEPSVAGSPSAGVTVL
jgi:hypothetical protein